MILRPHILLTASLALLLACGGGVASTPSASPTPPLGDANISYQPVQLNAEDTKTVTDWLKGYHGNYDATERMIKTTITGWQYHTDAISGTYHSVRNSFLYAAALLDSGDAQYEQRAFDVVDQLIGLQDQDPASKSCGVWPYYLEEPLATKKSPIDYNMADFNGVSLLEVLMGHEAKLPAALKAKVKNALTLAAKAIQKRNIGPDYTNIAIMGSYVTYLTAHLYGIDDLKTYADKRLQTFYAYTQDKNGFSEYNSPTYTIEALDELDRMRRHIVEPGAKKMIDELYATGWKMIARHYHKPSAQWAGPHSRSYGSIVGDSFYTILKQGSAGQISLPKGSVRSDVKIKHQIPAELLPYFMNPSYPRTETDIFEKVAPQITGTCFLTPTYAFATANRSSLWNQRRPFLAHWGDIQKPKYLQLRFLHNLYDFSAAGIYVAQKENVALAAIGFSTNGGDKHISLDRLSGGKFKATDLRLRFEFGNGAEAAMALPTAVDAPFTLSTDGLNFRIHLFKASFGGYAGHWEKGSESKTAWVDFVFYSGSEVDVDLSTLSEAVLGFSFAMGGSGDTLPTAAPQAQVSNQKLSATWNGLSVEAPSKPGTEPKNL